MTGATAGAFAVTYDDRPIGVQVNPNFPLTRRAAGDPNEFAGADVAAAGQADVLPGLFGLIDELRAELATDPPGQLALARAAFGQNDGEFRRDVDEFGDDLHAAIRDVRDRAIARQPACPELDLREPPAQMTLASTTVLQHVDPSPSSAPVDPASQLLFTEDSLEFA
jgi:hypothetical protein